MYFPLLVGVCICFWICYASLYVHSNFAVILKRKIKLIALLLLSYCKCSVALPNGALGGSTVCDCGIS